MSVQISESNKNYSLVKETYPLEEAKDLLMDLLAGTIRFHTVTSLRSWERKGVKNPHSEKRIDELKQMRENIIKMFKTYEDEENISVEIDTEIQLVVKKS